MSEVTAFPPLGCRGRLVDPGVLGSLKPFRKFYRIVYEFLGEPIFFWPTTTFVAYKMHSYPYSDLYLVSKVEGPPGDTYEVLRQPECYLALVDNEGEDPTWNVLKLWRVDFDTIPRHLLPPPGQMPLESC